MTPDEARESLVAYWMESANEALASARAEAEAGRERFAMNRAYYACFYAASALLLREGRKFVRHTGIREAVHRDLVNTGRLEKEHGQAYDRLFTARHLADYGEIIYFDKPKVLSEIEQAEHFVKRMKEFLHG